METAGSLTPGTVHTIEDADHLASYVGRLVSRLASGPFTGVCPTCNNLQPHGHEKTADRVQGRFYDRYHNDPDWLASRAEASVVPSLEIEDIKINDLLACRRLRTDGRYENSCRYCRFVCEVLEAVLPRTKQAWASGRDSSAKTLTLMIRKGKPLIICCTSFDFDPGWERSRIDIEVYHLPEETLPDVEGVPALGPATARSTASDSPENIAFIHECMQECINEHEICQAAAPVDAFIPSRLLYIGGHDIKLYDAWNEFTPIWAALSHSWGGRSILTLTTDSLAEMKSFIALETLPATFKDAIRVARELGIEFIWIDSLCILQDSAEDWQRESSKMGQIYHNATVVISAASSSKPEIPFLCERSRDWEAHRLTLRLKDGTDVPLLARRRQLLAASVDQGLKEPPYTRAWATLRRVGPLYFRAWTFQETLLPVRVLHFTPGGLIFECKTHRRSEGHLPPHTSTIEGTLGVRTAAEKWRLLVCAYTYRYLTFPKDKLPALSGIAAAMHHERGCEYLAGLWKDSLAIDLLWHVMPGAGHYPLTQREYVAPSWSWASVARGVTWTSYPNPKIVATDIQAQCSTKGLNPLGEVSTGTLTIRGRVLPCRIRHDNKTREYFAYFVKPNKEKSDEQWFLPDGLIMHVKQGGIANPSDPEAMGIRRALWVEGNPWEDFDGPALFLCIAETSWLDFGHIGLLLGFCPSSPGPGILQRIGCISNLSEEWYDCGEERTVTVV